MSLHDVVVRASSLPQLKKRIAGGADVNQRDRQGRQPIHVAVNMTLVPTVRVLLDAGADLNGRDDMDLTPLMLACIQGKSKGSAIAMLLIAAGARVNEVRKGDGMTALNWAAKNCEPRVVEALLAAGAPVDGRRGADMTPLMFAAMGGNVPALKVLVRHGADIQRKRTRAQPALLGLTAKGHAQEFRQRKALAYLESLEE